MSDQCKKCVWHIKSKVCPGEFPCPEFIDFKHAGYYRKPNKGKPGPGGPGRSRIGKENRIVVTIAMEPRLKRALSTEARLSGYSLSRMGCIAIEKFLRARAKTRDLLGI